jgi:cation transport ATPase
MPTEQFLRIDPPLHKPLSAKTAISDHWGQVTIPVSGMTCAACQGRVQRALEKEAGVAAASVNLLLKNAVITYDPAATSPAALVDAIKRTGYEAELPTPDRSAFDEQTAQNAAHDHEYGQLRRKAVLTGLAALAAMVLSMPLMIASEAGASWCRLIHAMGLAGHRLAELRSTDRVVIRPYGADGAGDGMDRKAGRRSLMWSW